MQMAEFNLLVYLEYCRFPLICQEYRLKLGKQNFIELAFILKYHLAGFNEKKSNSTFIISKCHYLIITHGLQEINKKYLL